MSPTPSRRGEQLSCPSVKLPSSVTMFSNHRRDQEAATKAGSGKKGQPKAKSASKRVRDDRDDTKKKTEMKAEASSKKKAKAKAKAKTKAKSKTEDNSNGAEGEELADEPESKEVEPTKPIKRPASQVLKRPAKKSEPEGSRQVAGYRLHSSSRKINCFSICFVPNGVVLSCEAQRSATPTGTRSRRRCNGASKSMAWRNFVFLCVDFIFCVWSLHSWKKTRILHFDMALGRGKKQYEFGTMPEIGSTSDISLAHLGIIIVRGWWSEL